MLTQPWSHDPARAQYQKMIYNQYRTDRTHRTLKGIDEQIHKAQTATASQTTVKRNRLIKLTEAKIECEPRIGIQDPHPGQLERLHHQHQPPHPKIHDQGIPPTLTDQETLPHVKARPRHTPDLPPATRPDRNPPNHHVRCPSPDPPPRSCHQHHPIRQLIGTLQRYRTIDIQAGNHIITAENPTPPNTTT